MRFIFATLCPFLCLYLTGDVYAQDDRKPVPDSASREKAESLLREIFEEEYGRTTSAAKKALASKMYKQALETTDDIPTQYVALDECRRLAVEAGSADMALEAIGALDDRFQVDGVDLLLKALSSFRGKAKAPAEHLVIASTYLSVVDMALENEDFSTAQRAAESAGAAARRGKNVPMATRARAIAKRVSQLRKEFLSVKKGVETLKKNPDDKEANLVVGQYECFTKGDWAAGLSKLAKSSDPKLSALARKDLEKPVLQADVMEAGDAWWEIAESTSGKMRSNLRQRAGYWYEKALPGASGIHKTKIEKRLYRARFEKLGPEHLWAPLDTPSAFGVAGQTGEPVASSAATDLAEVVLLKKWPAGDYDGFTARVRFETFGKPEEDKGVQGGLAIRGGLIITLIDTNGWFVVKKFTAPRMPYEVLFHTELTKADSYTVSMVISGGQYLVYLNGQELHRLPAPERKLVKIGFITAYGKALYDEIKIRKKE